MFWWSVDGSKWNGPVDLFTETGDTNSATIQAAYNTVNTLGLKMRFGLAGRSTSAGTTEYATVTCALAYVFRS